MAPCDPLELVVVLDLDDTLYKEIDYQISGFNAVCNWIENVYGLDLRLDLEKLLQAKNLDVLGELCKAAGLQPAVKESLLWVYRLHQPMIQSSPGVAVFLNELEATWQAVVLTDGRSVSQRLKLKALGLAHLPAYISEDYGSEKPAPDRFELVMREMPAIRYVYVGDNLKKDFIAPNKLGWTTVCLRDNGRNIHKQIIEEETNFQNPEFWIEDFFELKGKIKNEAV
jgi:putative hydrolase of the HAD superfamily